MSSIAVQNCHLCKGCREYFKPSGPLVFNWPAIAVIVNFMIQPVLRDLYPIQRVLTSPNTWVHTFTCSTASVDLISTWGAAGVCVLIDAVKWPAFCSYEVLRKVIYTGRCQAFYSFGVGLWKISLLFLNPFVDNYIEKWFSGIRILKIFPLYVVCGFIIMLIRSSWNWFNQRFFFCIYCFFSCSVCLWGFLSSKLLKEEQKHYRLFHCGSYCLYDQSRPALTIFDIIYWHI